jgi:hypothetical protein
MSGGGGTGLCSDFRGICAEGEGHPPTAAASSTWWRSASPRRGR